MSGEKMCQICQQRRQTGYLRYSLYLCLECECVQRARSPGTFTAFNQDDPAPKTYAVTAVKWTWYKKKANKKKASGWYKKVYKFTETEISPERLANCDGSYVARIYPKDVKNPRMRMDDIPLNDMQPPINHWEIRETDSIYWLLRGTLVGVPFTVSSRGGARHE